MLIRHRFGYHARRGNVAPKFEDQELPLSPCSSPWLESRRAYSSSARLSERLTGPDPMTVDCQRARHDWRRALGPAGVHGRRDHRIHAVHRVHRVPEHPRVLAALIYTASRCGRRACISWGSVGRNRRLPVSSSSRRWVRSIVVQGGREDDEKAPAASLILTILYFIINQDRCMSNLLALIRILSILLATCSS